MIYVYDSFLMKVQLPPGRPMKRRNELMSRQQENTEQSRTLEEEPYENLTIVRVQWTHGHVVSGSSQHDAPMLSINRPRSPEALHSHAKRTAASATAVESIGLTSGTSSRSSLVLNKVDENWLVYGYSEP